LESLGFALAGVSLLVFAFISLRSALPFAYVFMAFALMHFFHNIGPANITYLYPVEIFPTRLRATAMGISTAASRIGAILGVFAFPLFLSDLSLTYGLIFFAVFGFIGLSVTMILAPETRGKPIN
jgi:putative MFS transporter